MMGSLRKVGLIAVFSAVVLGLVGAADAVVATPEPIDGVDEWVESDVDGESGELESEGGVTEIRLEKIRQNCNEIRSRLVEVQHGDARERVQLGRYYEMFLKDFITPLNVALVENNSPNEALVLNQNNFIRARAKFAADFVEYQKVLEELVKVNCAAEPERFYTELEHVRELRDVVANDVKGVWALVDEQITIVGKLRSEL